MSKSGEMTVPTMQFPSIPEFEQLQKGNAIGPEIDQVTPETVIRGDGSYGSSQGTITPPHTNSEEPIHQKSADLGETYWRESGLLNQLASTEPRPSARATRSDQPALSIDDTMQAVHAKGDEYEKKLAQEEEGLHEPGVDYSQTALVADLPEIDDTDPQNLSPFEEYIQDQNSYQEAIKTAEESSRAEIPDKERSAQSLQEEVERKRAELTQSHRAKA